MTILFVDAEQTLVNLTYDADGVPMVIAAGKKRDRDKDLEAIKKWMRAIAAQSVGYQGPG